LAGAGEKSNRVNTEHSDNDFSGLGFKSIQEQAAYVINPSLDRTKFIDFATPYFALSLITTCLATLLIIFRILTMTDHTTRQSRGYSRVIEVVVESALLYSVAMAIFLPLLVRNSSNDAYAQAVVGQVTVSRETWLVAAVLTSNVGHRTDLDCCAGHLGLCEAERDVADTDHSLQYEVWLWYDTSRQQLFDPRCHWIRDWVRHVRKVAIAVKYGWIAVCGHYGMADIGPLEAQLFCNPIFFVNLCLSYY
jgi:hypothetical protein